MHHQSCPPLVVTWSDYCGTPGQQDVSREVEAAAAAAKAEAEAEENLNDLLACLGQEERKTERLALSLVDAALEASDAVKGLRTCVADV
jgi:Uso1 / p115 like vesicle tethering protein, C terminal region